MYQKDPKQLRLYCTLFSQNTTKINLINRNESRERFFQYLRSAKWLYFLILHIDLLLFQLPTTRNNNSVCF